MFRGPRISPFGGMAAAEETTNASGYGRACQFTLNAEGPGAQLRLRGGGLRFARDLACCHPSHGTLHDDAHAVGPFRMRAEDEPAALLRRGTGKGRGARHEAFRCAFFRDADAVEAEAFRFAWAGIVPLAEAQHRALRIVNRDTFIPGPAPWLAATAPPSNRLQMIPSDSGPRRFTAVFTAVGS